MKGRTGTKRGKETTTLARSASWALLALFGASFLISLGFFEIYRNLTIPRETIARSEERASAIDRSLSNVFFDVASLSQNIQSEENAEYLRRCEDKDAGLLSLWNAAGPSEELYQGMSLALDGEFLSPDGSAFSFGSEEISLLEENARKLIVLGNYGTPGGASLVLGIHSGGISGFYFVKDEVVSSFLMDEVEGARNYLVDRNGIVLAEAGAGDSAPMVIPEAESGERMSEEEGAFFLVRTELDLVSRYGKALELVRYVPWGYLYGVFLPIEASVLSALLLATLAMGGVLIYLFRKISKPIRDLSAEIAEELKEDDLRKVDLSKKRRKGPKDEIDILSDSYYDMIGRIQMLMEKQEQDYSRQRQLELDALQMQINPHFLYNVLDTITWMAKLGGNKNIEEFAIALANFYRLSLHKGAKYVSVKEEMEIVHYFLEIQLRRYPGLFTYGMRLDPSVEDCRTLKLILQPFVENAVKYAFPNEEEAGRIEVRALPYGEGRILFEVEDNGAGFSPAEARKRNEGSRRGFGIKNVEERLHLEYKEEVELAVESEPGKGTKVRILIPRTPPSGGSAPPEGR